MASAGYGEQPTLRTRFESGREACRSLLRSCCTADGHFLPMTVAELVHKLQAEGFPLTRPDAEAMLRELVADGEAVEIDSSAGYRWRECAA